MTREMMKILEANGYLVFEWACFEADIFFEGKLVTTVYGEWGLHNWMVDMGLLE